MNRRTLLTAILATPLAALPTMNPTLAAGNAVSRRLVIPGIDDCTYLRAEPRRQQGATLPFLDAWLVTSDDDTTIDDIPTAFRTAYTDASADSSRRRLTDSHDTDLDRDTRLALGKDTIASTGTYIDPSAEDTVVAIWSALHLPVGNTVLTLVSDSPEDPLPTLVTVAESILARKRSDPDDLLPLSADLPRGMRITTRATTIPLGSD